MKKTQFGATILEGSDIADLPLVSRNAQILEDEILKDRSKLEDKVDKEAGKGLSSNDFTNAFKKKIETDIPNSVNAVDKKVGDLSKLKTKDKANIVNAINEIITKNPDDITNSPGANYLVAGTRNAGFFGEVLSSDFISGDALCSRLGITEGESQFSTTPWLKFVLDGKILFRPKKAIRHSISWNHLKDKNCIYGDKIIEINGVKYKVRLMRGALTDPSKYSDSDRGAKGSEWNRLMLPIHIQAKDQSWTYPDYVEKDIPYWGIDYTDADLQLGGSLNGRAVWCQEKTNESGDYRVYRGTGGVSCSLSYDPSYALSHLGFAPVLEVVSDN